MECYVDLMYNSYFIYTDESHVAIPFSFQKWWNIPEKIAMDIFEKCNAGKGTVDAWSFLNEDDAISALTILKMLRCNYDNIR